MNTASLMTKEQTDPLLTAARENLKRDGFLVPVLLLKVGEKIPLLILPLAPPATPEQKQAYFARIGASYRRSGHLIQEAILIAESWLVQAHQAPAAFRFLPSQHPCRQEVLTLIGRNATNTRCIQVIQPFTRDTVNKPVWREATIALYNQPVGDGSHAQGLLDDLFLANQPRGG